MREFVDERGRSWGIRVDVTTIRKVREKVGIDLTKAMDSQENLRRLVDDVVSLVDVLHVLCLEQCSHRNVSAEDFATALYGDAISRATSALMESIIDFFPQSRGKILRQLWTKSIEMVEIQTQKMQEAADVLTLPILSPYTPDMPELTLSITPSENSQPLQRPHGKRRRESKRSSATD